MDGFINFQKWNDQNYKLYPRDPYPEPDSYPDPPTEGSGLAQKKSGSEALLGHLYTFNALNT